MLSNISRGILRYRGTVSIILLLITLFFGWKASKIELSYSYARALPKSDSAFVTYEKFKELFGEDGSVLVLGFEDKNFFELKKFNDWYDLADAIKSIEGIQDVVCVPKIYNLHRDDSLMKFSIEPVVKEKPKTQQELDSIKEILLSLPFYSGLAYNKETGATLMAVTFDKNNLNSKNRISIAGKIEEAGLKFAKDNKIDIHFSGMPFIRTKYAQKIASEMEMFMILAVLVIAIILYVFFRSLTAVFFSIIVCLVGVVVSVGTIVLMEYKINVLSGLIPPLIMVIGVPNCIFIINKYQEELLFHGNKIKALSRTIEKVSLSNFLANVTTGIGFGVFYFTNSVLLMEFGIVAAINVMTTYAIAHILLPIIYSYLPAPSARHTKHLKGKRINRALEIIDNLVHNHRRKIYGVIAILVAVSVWGMMKIKIIGFVVDDLPQKDRIYTDMHFFEKNFGGVLPFEIIVDTKKENGVFSGNARTLYKIKTFQKSMEQFPELSKPISAVEVLKFANQGYNDGNPKHFILPGVDGLKKLSDYASGLKGNQSKLASFIDSTKRFTRISFQMKDIGSDKMKLLIAEVKPKLDTIFNFDKETKTWVADSLKYDVSITGNSLVFLKSNDYLFHHLFVSLLIAIGLILIIGMALFRSVAIIVLSKVPCLIPLLMTAGIMGFLDIHFKPSTILIFSIAFGIASDGTIYILAEYRNQLRKTPRHEVKQSVSRAVRGIGISMIYTNIILFFSFAIFAASSFGGTQALGILISITLLVSLLTNLILLPCILLSLEKRKYVKAMMQEPLINIIDEEEDIDLEKLVIQKQEQEKQNEPVE